MKNTKTLWFYLFILTLTSSATAEELKPPRWLGFEGAVNTRDAGGYPAIENKIVKWNLLYRSNALNALTPSDEERFRSLGIKTVVDFRTVSQTAGYPDHPVVPEIASYHHLPINIEGASYIEIYLNIVNKYAPSLASAFHLLASPDNLPLLCHCAAGKDRTGIFVALTHRLLGVSEEDIHTDYLLSLEINYAVQPEWLDSVLQQVDDEGGIESFLANRGVNHEIQQAIRENLLEESSGIMLWELYE